ICCATTKTLFLTVRGPSHKPVRSRPPNRVMAARSLGGQVHALTLSRDGCGRCDGHHKIVDWVENEPRGWPFPCTCVVQYHSRKWKLHRRYNPDNAFVTGLCY